VSVKKKTQRPSGAFSVNEVRKTKEKNNIRHGMYLESQEASGTVGPSLGKGAQAKSEEHSGPQKASAEKKFLKGSGYPDAVEY